MAKKKKGDVLDFVSLPTFGLGGETAQTIWVLAFFILAVIIFLGFFGSAGLAGAALDKALTLILGQAKWLLPLCLLGAAILIYGKERWEVGRASFVGLILLLLAYPAFLSLFIGQSDWTTLAKRGVGGGEFGFALAGLSVKLIGFFPTALLIVILLILGLMLIFRASLAHLIGLSKWPAKLLMHPVKLIWSKVSQREAKDEAEEEKETEGAELVEENEEEKEADDEDEEEDETPIRQPADKTAAAFTAPAMMEQASAKGGAFWQPTNIEIDLPLDLLSDKSKEPNSGDIKSNTAIIKKTFANFGIPVEMSEVHVGPTVTQYTLKPLEGIRLSNITALDKDLSLALAAHPLRIEAPIPGKSLVGIEVPNKTIATVTLREALESETFDDRKTNTTIVLGKDVAGKIMLDDLCRMPHLLVAGQTGSGKSVMLNTIIVSLIYQNNPDDLRLIMVDPKRVEMTIYNGIPHLLTPVITEVSKTVNALKWCLNEMDRRFETLSKVHKRDIASYNQVAARTGKPRLPYIVFIIDELADLMMVAGKEIEAGVVRLSQMARAVGIHLILATQRPSVNVITGTIKANMPARIAFTVASSIDSRTILDATGAEKLLGRGDMLYTNATMSKPKRIQGAFIGDREIKRVVDYLKHEVHDACYVDGVVERQKVHGVAGVGMEGNASDDDDEMLHEARELVLQHQKASATFLQRRLSVGYARAARLLDILEEQGLVGPSNGAKPREIMMTLEQYESSQGQTMAGMPVHNQQTAQAPNNYLSDGAGEGNDDEDNDYKYKSLQIYKSEDESDSDELEDDENIDEDPGDEEEIEADEEREAEDEEAEELNEEADEDEKIDEEETEDEVKNESEVPGFLDKEDDEDERPKKGGIDYWFSD